MEKMNIISQKSKIGKNVTIGYFNIIEEDVIIGDNVKIGSYCHLKSGVTIGDNTVLMNYIELRSNTKIGKSCYVDSKVSSSGNVKVGDYVTLRYDTILARGVEVGEGTYICPRVMTNNLDSSQSQIGGAKIGKRCFVGTNAVLQHGIVIEDEVLIGSMTFVNKDCNQSGVYIGIPAKKIK
jgi:UDP-3-O-[3-hydroxymyristoyl] glucosamine N-acyltransferase